MGTLRGLARLTAVALLACLPLSTFAAFPDGSVPTSLANHMPATWNLSSVTNKIWVAPNGNGNGSQESTPYGSIQDAIDAATPGTVILVKAGTYVEELDISSSVSTANGTDASPILLVSADGLDAATIQSTTGDSTINGYRIQNWGVIGFKIIGSGSKTSGDNSPVKIGSANITSGPPAQNWFVAGNRLQGQGRDGSKFYSGRNIFWFGNTYEGSWGQEVCDVVTVGVQNTNGQDNQFAFNTTRGSTGYSVMTLKYGTNNFLILNNDFGTDINGGGSAIRLGGDGNIEDFIDTIPSDTEGDFDPETANKVRISFNAFTTDTGRDVHFYGARECEVSGNNLDNPNSVYPVDDDTANIGSNGQGGPYLSIDPANNSVLNNKLPFGTTQTNINNRLEFESTYTVSGNSSSVSFNKAVGASQVAPLLESLIYTLRYNTLISEVLLGENTDFENGNDGSWSLSANTSIQSATTYGSSAYAAAITPNGTYRIVTQNNIPVIAGELLTASCQIKISGLDSGKQGLFQLRFYDTDAGGTYNGSIANPVSAGNVTIARKQSTAGDNWELVPDTDVIVPDDADIMRIWLAAQNSTGGTVYFDNVVIKAEDQTVNELLQDPDFEEGNSNSAWSLHGSGNIDATGGVSGSKAFNQPATSSYTASTQTVDMTGISTVSASGYVKSVNLAAGRRAIIQVRFHSSGGTLLQTSEVGEVTGTSSGYVLLSANNISVPANTSYARFWLAVTGGNQGEAWFDDLHLEIVN